MSFGSPERRRAKEELKRKYLEEFQNKSDYTKDELKEINKLVKLINSRLAQ
ncbi:hypothetical protein MPC4_220056 [Methylocella tundrae]|uniref:Uncharacterized protein n=1 Tax=Methylocella tundrae TaxID=227605 RepID=A0A8B6M6F5_METTU|nr:hypothetical protein MPC1_3880007 [Methylocella tundrae]VTZ50326.1 hypothetical protein MPC4_220056 [Methylocella tundrae]